MKHITPLLLIFFMVCPLYGQQPTSYQTIISYLSEAKEYAVLYNGKEQIPYAPGITNHPYLVTNEYTSGTICYNNVVYEQIQMRFDLYKDEIMVRPPNKPYNIILEKEKINYVLLNGVRIVPYKKGQYSNVPAGNFTILLNEGAYLVIANYTVSLKESISGTAVEGTFRFKRRYYLCKEGICYPIFNKKSILKLFPDKKNELDSYARQQKLKFRKDPEGAFVAIVEQYEKLSP